MARSRNIKPAFFLNTDLSEVDPLARLAFIGLWTLADFKGCLECNIKRIKAQILPYDECDFNLLMNNLEQFRFIRYYNVQGKRYIKIPNFEKHQNPHKNEREAGSDIPDISEKDNEIIEMNKDGTKPDFIGTTRADSLLLIPDSLNIDSVSAEKSYAPKQVGKALPKDWVLPKAWGEWALSERQDLSVEDVRKISESFKDHWLSTANQAKSKRADWEATWRNWIRRQEVSKSKFKNKSDIISDSQFENWLNSGEKKAMAING